MKVKYDDNVIVYNTYSSEEYDRSNIIFWLMRNIYSLYKIEDNIIKLINNTSNYKILTENTGEYNIKIKSLLINKWYEDNISKKLEYTIKEKEIEFIDIYEYIVREMIRDGDIGFIQFKFYDFNIEIDNIIRCDENDY